MSDSQKNLYCTDCGTLLPTDQFTRLFQGETVYCEKCGRKFQAQVISNSTSKSKSWKEKDWKAYGLSLKKKTKRLGKVVVKGTRKIGIEIKKVVKPTTSEKTDPSDPAQTPPPPHPQNNTSESYSQVYRKEGSRWQKQTPNRNRQQAVPPFQQRYGYFRRFNMITITFELLYLLIYGVIVVMALLPALQAGTATFASLLDANIERLGVGAAILLYDSFYVCNKIEKRDFQNYGIDFAIIGLLGTIFGGSGLLLMIKGGVVMMVALTDSTLFSGKYKRTFGDVFLTLTNLFVSLYGFLILIVRNPFTTSLEPIYMTYFYIALGALLVDLVFLRHYSVNRRMREMPLWIGIIKLVAGVVASFFFMAGILLAIEGGMITFGALFREDFSSQPR
ncbi:MAG: hypothetical protein ACTSWW_13120 [Promethearchaeota archaeon]